MSIVTCNTVRDVCIATIGESRILSEDLSLEIARELSSVIGSMPNKSLLLNLENVNFMASAMIGKLCLVRNQCRDRSIRFSLCSMNEKVAEAIGLVRLDTIIDTFPDQASALNALAPAR